MRLNAIGLLSVIVPAICAVNMLLPRTAEESSGSSLAGSSWRLVKFTGGDDTVLTPEDKAEYTVAFALMAASVCKSAVTADVAHGNLPARANSNLARWRLPGQCVRLLG